MQGPGRVLLWTAVTVVAVITAVAGFVVYQLSNLYPDEASGEQLVAELDRELGAQQAFTVTTLMDRPFAEIKVDLTPTAGALDEADLLDALAVVERIADDADDDWSVVSTVRGDWAGARMRVNGYDTGTWDELSRVVAVADRPDVAYTLDLGRRSATVTADQDGGRWCEGGEPPVSFFTEFLDDSEGTLAALEWLQETDPRLRLDASACDRQLRSSATLIGPDRDRVLGDLRATVEVFPADALLAELHADDRGALHVLLAENGGGVLSPADLTALHEELVGGWPHGEVRLNGELLE